MLHNARKKTLFRCLLFYQQLCAVSEPRRATRLLMRFLFVPFFNTVKLMLVEFTLRVYYVLRAGNLLWPYYLMMKLNWAKLGDET